MHNFLILCSLLKWKYDDNNLSLSIMCCCISWGIYVSHGISIDNSFFCAGNVGPVYLLEVFLWYSTFTFVCNFIPFRSPIAFAALWSAFLKQSLMLLLLTFLCYQESFTHTYCLGFHSYILQRIKIHSPWHT